jgi:hypothetical protein
VKRAITITGYRRPHLFRMLLQSLAANDLRGWQIYVQLEPTEFIEEYRAATAELMAGIPISIEINSSRLGVRFNPHRLLDRVFNEGAELVLYAEEDLLLSADAITLAQWYFDHHRPEWMSLSLLCGGCGSAGFISDPNYPDLLFPSKSFNSLGFALRRNEWQRHFRDVWLYDHPQAKTLEGQPMVGWDWAVYHHLLVTEGLYGLQVAAARATHTGREAGVYCTPEWHDLAFGGLKLAEGSRATRNYQVVSIEALPPSLRRQALLWQQANIALRVIEERSSHVATLMREIEGLRRRLAEQQVT